MMRIARVGARNVNTLATLGFCEAHCPPQIASSTKMNPRADTSSTLPGRIRRRYSPISSAMGIVIAIVNVPQGLSFRALTTTQRNHAEENEENRNHGRVGNKAAHAPDLFFGHFSERLAVAANGEKQNHEVLHATGKDGAGQHPQRSGKIAELRGQHRAHQGARSGDGGKMMAEHDPFVRHQKIATVFQSFGRGGAQGIERENLRRDEFAVKTISEGVAAGRSHDQPQGVNRFTAVNGDHANRRRLPSSPTAPQARIDTVLFVFVSAFISVEHCGESCDIAQCECRAAQRAVHERFLGHSALASVDLVLLYLFQPIFTLVLGILHNAALGVHSEDFILNSTMRHRSAR